LRFEKRAEPPAAAPAASGSGSQAAGKAPAPAPAADSSDESDVDSSADEMEQDDDGDSQTGDGWMRNDSVRSSQRAKEGIHDTANPILKIPHSSSLYEYAMHFLPLDELEALAERMTANGLAKYDSGKGDRRYNGWNVLRRHVEKWLGVWMYFLAFPIEGSRREYWTGFEGGFGPKNCLERYGVTKTWFEMMQATFSLPTYGKPSDPLNPTRRWWDALFAFFAAAIDAGYVLNPDESMIQWLGKHMPGFMSVGRKPTDKGREVHTVCDAISGIMVGGEVFEGAAAMEHAEFTAKFQKSTALTLRLVKPWFGTNRIVVADSWFGSVQTVLALYEYGLYGVLNVKTAHRGYPKAELYREVWDESAPNINKARAKELGKFPKYGGKRGLHAGFIKVFDVKGSSIEVVAGGHNAKQPMLLVSTASDLLPGDPQVKEWHTMDETGKRIEHTHKTPQPRMHAFYRKYFHLVDDHNQLRSGTVTMADVWETTAWAHRDFAESLGLWEVNVFKALVRWNPEWKGLKHPRFRRLLSHAMLTGGVPLIEDLDREAPPVTPSRTLEEGHQWMSFAARSKKEGEKREAKGYEGHRCGYCPAAKRTPIAYGFCSVCFPLGTVPAFAICGPSTGNNCMHQHCNGVAPRHMMQKRKRDEASSSTVDL